MKYTTYLVFLTILSCNQSEIRKESNLFENSYFFSDTSSASVITKNVTGRQFFLLNDDEFLNCNCDFHVVYIYAAWNQPICVYSIKSKHGINILTSKKINDPYNNLQECYGDSCFINNFSYASSSKVVPYGQLVHIKARIDRDISFINKRINKLIDEDSRTLYYYNGTKHYLFNQNYVSRDIMLQLDSTIRYANIWR